MIKFKWEYIFFPGNRSLDSIEGFCLPCLSGNTLLNPLNVMLIKMKLVFVQVDELWFPVIYASWRTVSALVFPDTCLGSILIEGVRQTEELGSIHSKSFSPKLLDMSSIDDYALSWVVCWLSWMLYGLTWSWLVSFREQIWCEILPGVYLLKDCVPACWNLACR